MEIRPAREDEIDVALALVASYVGGRPVEAVAVLRQAAERGELDLSHLTVAVEDDRILGAVLAIVAPGRTAFLTAPGAVKRRLERDVAVALYRHWRTPPPRLDLAMIQTFTQVNDKRQRRFLEAAGYEHLSDLIYLERPADVRTGEAPLPDDVSWRTYSDDTHAAFGRMILATYEGTLDCPRLSGLRLMDDVIAGHKAQGRFDPDRWLLVAVAGEEVGCLLLNAIPERDSLDITYMGLAPGARQRGLGRVLVQAAIDETRRAGRPRLTCAVDVNNLPAVRTYRHYDFRSTDAKRVFIAAPDRPAND